MQFIITLMLTVALLLAAALTAKHYLQPKGEDFANSKLVNISPKGRCTRLADANFTLRYLICKAGSDASHIDICTASDIPLGVVTDQTPTTDQAASDLSYPLPVNLLGLNEDSERMIASAAIAVGDFVVPAAAGKVKTLPASGGGTTYIIGRALSAAAADLDQVEVVPCFPTLATIAA